MPPLNETPSAVLPPADIAKPAASASPPAPPVTDTPSTSNWNPLTAWNGLSYNTSNVPVDTEPNVRVIGKHQEPSTSHPQPTSTASPPQSPLPVSYTHLTLPTTPYV